MEKNNKPVLVVSLLIALIVCLWVFFWMQGPKGQAIKGDIPNVALSDLTSNKSVNLNALVGRPFIVHFWATWCGVCIKEHTDWSNIANLTDAAIVGINYVDDQVSAKMFLQQKGNPYSLTLSDSRGDFGMHLGLKGTPETFVVNGEGKMVYRHTGPVSISTFEQEILPLLS